MPERTSRPYGSWPSPLTSERVVKGALHLSQARLEGDRLIWLERRPDEGGRQQVMALDLSTGAMAERSPTGVNVRTLVHEYGGGDYAVRGDQTVYSDFSDQRIYVHEPGREPRPLSEAGPRYADYAISPDGNWLAAIEEAPRDGGEPVNRVVAFRMDGSAGPIEVAAGRDFFSSPRFSPAGERLCFIAWDHPDMPWDRSTLHELDWKPPGPAGAPRQLAGGEDESIVEPCYAPHGRLHFASDRSGWWNLYGQQEDAAAECVHEREAEFAGPHWVFGLRHYAFSEDGRIHAVCGERDGSRLVSFGPGGGAMEARELPGLCVFSSLDVANGRLCFLAAGPLKTAAVYTLELASGKLCLHRESAEALPEAWLSEPEAIEFPTEGGRSAFAFYYAPCSPDCEGLPGERPPLLVKSHGGPSAATAPALDPRIQFWTSRGIAVVDVNYGGSTGYGRAYRERLRGQWGIVDVEDCANAARFLVERGDVDGERLAISGGSAGGYTTLCALTFTELFRAGASHYGIGDLEALLRDTHKFEARYLDGLIGPYPERADLYRERSPIHSCEKLSCPVIFFQGLEDKVVPPGQAEAMVAALRARGIPHAYVPFEGEQHGFRKAENIRTALDGELYFYGTVFGFEVEVKPASVRIEGR